jgi:hypothetical protein
MEFDSRIRIDYKVCPCDATSPRFRQVKTKSIGPPFGAQLQVGKSGTLETDLHLGLCIYLVLRFRANQPSGTLAIKRVITTIRVFIAVLAQEDFYFRGFALISQV